MTLFLVLFFIIIIQKKIIELEYYGSWDKELRCERHITKWEMWNLNCTTEKVIWKAFKTISNLTFLCRKTKKFSVSNYNSFFFLKMLYSYIIDHCAVHLHLSFKSLKIVLFSFRWKIWKKKSFAITNYTVEFDWRIK